MKTWGLILLASALVACSAPTPVTIIRESTVEVPVTVQSFVQVTRQLVITVRVTQLVSVTQLVPVTVTPTATPINSATPIPTATETPIPSETPLPSATPNKAQTATAAAFGKLTSPKGNGFYLVNVDIAPGVWRSTGTDDSCYWATTSRTGKIIDNHFGMAGGTAFIGTSAFQVEFNGCGRWEYVGQ